MALSQHETEVLRELERQFADRMLGPAPRWSALVLAGAKCACLILAGVALAVLALLAGPAPCVVAGLVLAILLGDVLAHSRVMHQLRCRHWQLQMDRRAGRAT